MRTIGSACTGIGGLDLGLEWAGVGRVVWQVEVDAFCRRVLARHWPNVNREIRYVQGIPAAIESARLDRVDVFVAGFPCQDISQANPGGAGLDGERSGLFWWCLDCIDAIEPRVVVFENVGRLARRGLDVVVAGLTRRGFAVECTRLEAGDVGTPQGRERVFFIGIRPLADAAPERRPERRNARPERTGRPESTRSGPLADSDMRGREEFREPEPPGKQRARGDESLRRDGANPWRRGPPQPGVGGAASGVPAGVDRYPWPAPRGLDPWPDEPPRLVEHYRGRRERLKALGNAVVPQCGYVVGRRLLEVLS